MIPSRALLIHTIPVLLSRDPQQIIAGAAEIGRCSGLDDDWVPADLDEAAWEIILSAGGPSGAASLGVIVRPDLDRAAERGDIFRLVVELQATEEIDRLVRDTRHLRPRTWPESFEAAVTAVLMAPAPPIDFDVEIVGLRKPAHESSHARLAASGAIAESLRRGQANAGT